MAANPSSTPTFPVPASARVHPITTPTASTPAATTPAKATVPTLTTPSSAVAPTTTTTAIAGHPVTHPAKHSESLSTAAIAAVIVAAVLVLACIAWALARRRAFEPHWLLSLRHAMAEAGFRLSATCAEFVDWARLGR